MMGDELQIATAAVWKLRDYGDAELQYITAEFEPFSSAQRPDIVFIPDSGRNQGRSFVVELRMPVDASRKLPTPEELKDHREFVDTDPPDSVYFALATQRTIDEGLRSAFYAQGIEVFDSIESGEDLANRVLKWSGIPRF
jgi:hypothetical protein